MAELIDAVCRSEGYFFLGLTILTHTGFVLPFYHNMYEGKRIFMDHPTRNNGPKYLTPPPPFFER
jgi:hypothetical protein